jgi:P-type Mg2+ transporter
MEIDSVLRKFESGREGLTADVAAQRLASAGPNVLAKDQRVGVLNLVWHAVLNPLVVLLAVLAIISFSTGDARAGSVMSIMIALGVVLKLVQEARADKAAAKLKLTVALTEIVEPRQNMTANRQSNTKSN